MKYKSGIIIFSSINWSTHNQLHHELTNYFSKNGHKILFVENTGTRSITIYDYKRVLHRITFHYDNMIEDYFNRYTKVKESDKFEY